MLLQKYLFNNNIRHSIKLNAKIQKLIKNKKKIVQNRKTRKLFYAYLTQNRLSNYNELYFFAHK